MDLSVSDCYRLFQWYNALKALSPTFLDQGDHDLMQKIEAVWQLKLVPPAQNENTA